MIGIRRLLRTDLFADALFEPVELGRDIAFGDAEHLGDLALAAFVQPQQQQRTIHRRLAFDHRVQCAHAFVGLVLRGAVVHRETDVRFVMFLQRFGAGLLAGAAVMRDRDVQRDPVHPGRERPRRVVAWKRAPQMRGDLLGQILAILLQPAVAIGHFEHDSAMLIEQCGEACIGPGAGRVHRVGRSGHGSGFVIGMLT